MPPGAQFYQSPLGVDPVFRQPSTFTERRPYKVLTSGYVNGHGMEALEEPAQVALALGHQPVHLGPLPSGLTKPWHDHMYHGIGDWELKLLYHRSEYVAAMRYVEGFEFPAAEGLVNGCRPIMFDRSDARCWFNDWAHFVPECSGPELEAHLYKILEQTAAKVTAEEIAAAKKLFNWSTIVSSFWALLKERM
jgi:hypothetical protein